MRKKLVGLILVMSMVLSFAPVIHAATIVASGNCGKNEDNITWTLDSDGMLTISGEGEMADFDGYYSVSPWYSQRENIKSVAIEGGVTSIGDRAFGHCRELTSITIPDSVTSIGDNAFDYCSGLTSITIPDSVTSIGNYAFSDCSGLTSITIPDSVTLIGLGAFYDCSGLTSITIPGSVTSVGNGAFFGCSNIEDVYYTGTEASGTVFQLVVATKILPMPRSTTARLLPLRILTIL